MCRMTPAAIKLQALEVLFIYPLLHIVTYSSHIALQLLKPASSLPLLMEHKSSKMQINMLHQGEDLIEAYDWPTF